MGKTLKPCPFCGGLAKIERRGTARQSMIVACEDCGARVESGDVMGATSPERLAWNQRRDDKDAEIERLRKALAASPCLNLKYGPAWEIDCGKCESCQARALAAKGAQV